MAKKQQIILTHGSGVPTFDKNVVKKGEVLVRHAADAKDAALYTPNNDETEFLVFPSKAYVDNQIDTINNADFGGQIKALETAYKAADKAINDKIGDGFDATNTVTKAISDETSARETADNAINDKIGEGFSESNTIADAIAAEATARETADNALQTEVGKKVDTTTYTDKVGEIDNSIANLNKIVKGYEGEGSIQKAVDSKVNTTTYEGKVAEIEGEIDAIQSTLNDLDTTYVNHTEFNGTVETLNAGIAAAKTTITVANPEAGIKVVKTTATAGDKNDNYEISLVGIATGSDLNALTQKVTTLIGDDTGKSARTIANEELAAQLLSGKADADFKTLQELAEWLEDHPESASAMNNAIVANTKAIGTGFSESNTIATAINGLKGDLQGEITNRTNADNDIKATIGGSYTKDNTVAAAIAAEVETREDADKAINDKIGEVEEGQTVVGLIAAEATARETADNGLSSRIKTVEDTYVKQVKITLADGTVKTFTPDNTNVLDLSEMIIDGGTY